MGKWLSLQKKKRKEIGCTIVEGIYLLSLGDWFVRVILNRDVLVIIGHSLEALK